MPGADAREAARTVAGSVEALPFLPELPARGPGADMIGRTLGMLVELYARVEPSGWRFGDRPGRDTRRARSWLGEDLDALEEFTQGYQGLLKVQAVGPWTLAADVELRGGEAALSDPGARRDLTASLAEGLRQHVADVAPPGPRRATRPPARRALADRRAARPGPHGQRLPHPPARWTARWSRARCATSIEAVGVPVDRPLLRARRAVRPAAAGRDERDLLRLRTAHASVTGTPSARPSKRAPCCSPACARHRRRGGGIVRPCR